MHIRPFPTIICTYLLTAVVAFSVYYWMDRQHVLPAGLSHGGFAIGVAVVGSPILLAWGGFALASRLGVKEGSIPLGIAFDSDKAKLRRFRLPLASMAILTGIACMGAHFEVVGARAVLAMANVGALCIAAALAGSSLVCVFRHRRPSFLIDLFIGLAGAVCLLVWIVPIYLYGLLRP